MDSLRLAFGGLITFASLLLCTTNESDVQTLHTSQAFHTEFWLNKSFKSVANLEVMSSIAGYADLPNWMSFYRKSNSPVGYFYGTPLKDDDGDIEIEVIVIDNFSFNTTRDHIKYRILGREDQPKFEVEIKFFEIDLQDFFQQNLQSTIREVFNEKLWRNNQTEVVLTRVERPFKLGGRFPLDPNEKEGVIVRVGSIHNFTEDLFWLENEVKIMRNRNPCPKQYKATSAEYIFRERKLCADWCSFRLRTL